MNDIVGWLCSTIMVVSFIGGIVYYNLEADKVIIAYIVENNLNPMIIECMGKQWNTVETYVICKLVAENPKISVDELNGGLD